MFNANVGKRKTRREEEKVAICILHWNSSQLLDGALLRTHAWVVRTECGLYLLRHTQAFIHVVFDIFCMSQKLEVFTLVLVEAGVRYKPGRTKKGYTA